jgi:hypothetical protein
MTVSMRIDLYEKVTGKKAGQIFDDSDIFSHNGRSPSPRRLPEYLSRYYPFKQHGPKYHNSVSIPRIT